MKKTGYYSIVLIILWVFFVQGTHLIRASTLQLNTSTPTSSLPSQTPTATSGTPAQTYTPFSASSQTPTATSGTPSQTYTPTSTASPTPTTTLEPLPAFTLIFPAVTDTSIPTITPVPAAATGTSHPPLSDGQRISPRITVASIILVVLWLILAGFLILFIRQFK